MYWSWYNTYNRKFANHFRTHNTRVFQEEAGIQRILLGASSKQTEDIRINDEIDIMSDQLLNELVTYDEYRLLKEQLEEKRENEDDKTPED